MAEPLKLKVILAGFCRCESGQCPGLLILKASRPITLTDREEATEVVKQIVDELSDGCVPLEEGIPLGLAFEIYDNDSTLLYVWAEPPCFTKFTPLVFEEPLDSARASFTNRLATD